MIGDEIMFVHLLALNSKYVTMIADIVGSIVILVALIFVFQDVIKKSTLFIYSSIILAGHIITTLLNLENLHHHVVPT